MVFDAPRRKIRIEACMPNHQLVGLTPVRKPFLAVLANGLQHAEASAQAAVFCDDKGAGDQAGDQVDHLLAFDGIATADLFDGFERAAAGEHGESGEEALLGGVEQLVRPVDCCAKRRVSLNGAASSASQHLESAVEAARKIGGAQRDHPRRRELDGQRDTVEALADLHDGTGVVVGQREVGLDVSCPFDEKS